MIKTINKNTLLVLLLHIILGLLFYQNKSIATFWSYSIFIIGFLLIIKTKNNYGIAHLISAYILGLEVVLRMVEANVLYEFGKYSVSVLLLLGIFLENQNRLKPYIILLYFYFLLPSTALVPFVDFNSWRMPISFNLSGPLSLTICCYYFYCRKFGIQDIKSLFLMILFPISTLIIVIFLRTPSLNSIVFIEESLHSLSGNFGPNQVSTVLGIGIIIIFFSKMIGLKLFKNTIIDYIFGSILLLQGLLTFSRGGIFSAVLAILIVYLYSGFRYVSKIKMLLIQLTTFVIIIIMWNISFGISDGMIQKRYYQTISSNRIDFIFLDFQIFKNNFLMGVGPGMSDKIREELYYYKASSHTEFTRLLSEHGFMGFISLLIILILPVKYFFSIKNLKSRMLVIVFIIASFSTMMHAAMRLVLPAFFFGLAFIDFKTQNKI